MEEVLYSEKFAKYDEETVKKAVEVALNPPVHDENYMKQIFKPSGVVLPPQPSKQFILEDELKKLIGTKDAVELFVGADQVLSLIPYNAYENIEKEGVENSFDEFMSWAKKIDSARRNFKVRDLYTEDCGKKSILMIIPGEIQFNVVHGRWTEWVWSRKTVEGKPSPDADEWFNEAIELGNRLKGEGVDVFFAAGEKEKERILEVSGNIFKIVEVEIPSRLAKIGYARDQSVVWFRNPIICNMALEIRRGEEKILNEIYWKIKKPPVLRPRWRGNRDIIERAVLEGGNFIVMGGNGEKVIFTGLGVRGTNKPAISILSDFLSGNIDLYGVPLSGYIRDWKRTGSVHLDVAMLYIGETNGVNLLMVDPGRIGFYSTLKFERERDSFTPKKLIEVAREFDLTLDEPPREGGSRITMVNALNLGRGKMAVDPYNKAVNKYLKETWGLDLIEVPVPQFEAGGGGIRCVTREIEYK